MQLQPSIGTACGALVLIAAAVRKPGFHGISTFLVFFILKMVYCVYDEAILMRTHNIPRCKRKSKIYPYFASWPGAMLSLTSSNYPCLEHVFHVPKVFEPWKFDYIVHKNFLPKHSLKRFCSPKASQSFFSQKYLGPVVQSIVSLTSSLRGQLVKCFMTL